MELFKPRFVSPEKLINWGDELLFKREEWVDPLLITGDDMTVLDAEIMKDAFNRVMRVHEPKHSVSFISLYTKTRPYQNSRKWATFLFEFGEYAELTVASNGGIVPYEFWNSYPYTMYDGVPHSKYDDIYIQILHARLESFFKYRPYKKIVFNFRPTLRGRVAAQLFKNNHPELDIVILPTEETYNQIKSEGFPAGKMFPDLDPRVLKEIKDELGVVDKPKGFGF